MAEKTKKEAPKKRAKSIRQQAKVLDLGGRIFAMVAGGAGQNEVSFRKIADALTASGESVSHTTVREYFYKFCEMTREEGSAEVESQRQVILAQMDDVILHFRPHMILKGTLSDNETKLKSKAGDVILKAAIGKAGVLGLNKPQQIELSGKDGGAISVVTQVTIEPVVSTIPRPEEPKE